ncbi:cation diffusion facilitator family transporter [Coxiella endosymbiont of Amblyomma americanum]|uniref:cation diffusion facilitator family transporter n=1 Tax=Coxiella endosymbiont of Amblyomma americanum TaxID=325775 RepID=UPI00057C6236|nr:cation diffusion facilitator family transporter [Coxiella endosymbiont of Amblyomma americanum]AJC50523.1 cation diffusion facilitator family transporter [Coxiella endosymbiont of Amblyomma americanum]
MKNKNRRLALLIRIALVSAVTNTVLALLKINIGIIGYSHALIVDGIHAISDLFMDGLIITASLLGARAPDKEHPYGHGRIETIGTIAISFILIFVVVGITFSTILHFMHHVHLAIPTFPVITVSAISIIVNEILFRYTLVIGKKINSDLLRTNAWHNRSDALISLVVLISAIGTRSGITFLDFIGTLIITLLILYVSGKMLWKNIQELIDTAVDDKTFENIINTIKAVPGVLSMHQLRSRLHGSNVFIDVHIQVAPDISVSEGHYISEKVHLSLINSFSYIADVIVHIDPENDTVSTFSINLPSREDIYRITKIHWKKFPSFKDIRRITLHYLDKKVYIEICLPLSAVQKEKEQLASQYQSITTKVKNIAKVSLYFE